MTCKEDIAPIEYAPFYANYIQLAPNNISLTATLETTFKEVFSFFSALNEDQGSNSYAENKWTLKEILLHLIDTERVMTYRALCFSRNDHTELPGFEQDDYVIHSLANKRTLISLLEEYKTVRKASLSLFTSFDDVVLKRSGIANGNKMSVRALGFVISGHERHHLNVAKSKYFLD